MFPLGFQFTTSGTDPRKVIDTEWPSWEQLVSQHHFSHCETRCTKFFLVKHPLTASTATANDRKDRCYGFYCTEISTAYGKESQYNQQQPAPYWNKCIIHPCFLFGFGALWYLICPVVTPIPRLGPGPDNGCPAPDNGGLWCWHFALIQHPPILFYC